MIAIFAAVSHLLALQPCALVFSAALPPPPLPPQSLSLLNNQLRPPSNITPPGPPNDLPPEPYSYRIPSTTITVKFYNFGDPLRDAIAVQEVLGAAFKDAESHLPYLEIPTKKLQYSEKYLNTVDLVLLPEPEMNWQMWRLAVLGIGDFMVRWDNVWLSFDVEVEGVRGRVGTGYVFKNFEGG